MTQRDWIEKDFYRELGVDSKASADEIKKAYRKLARELHPDANPGDAKAEARFKSVSEAYGVLSDEKKRREYDETRALFAGGGGFGGRARGFPGGFPGGAGGQSFDLNDLLNQAGSRARAWAAGRRGRARRPVRWPVRRRRRRAGAGPTAASRGPARRGTSRPRSGWTSSTRCAAPRCSCGWPPRAAASAAAAPAPGPGTAPRTCPTCDGVGLVSRSQGAFAFSEPCRDCRGTGRIIDDPCPECGGRRGEHPDPHAQRADPGRGGRRAAGAAQGAGRAGPGRRSGR